MKEVFVVFSRPQSFKLFSWLIRAYQGTTYSHSAIRFFDIESGKFLIAEAGHGEVHLMTEKSWRKINKKVDESQHQVTPEDFKIMRDFILDNLQVKYSISQNLGIILFDLFGVKLFLNKVEGFNCSELVARALPDVFKNYKGPIDYVKPSQIHTLIFGKK